MRHQKKGKKFGRKKGQRKAFLKTLAQNLIMRGKIRTTEARAKELKPFVDRLVTYGKKQNLAGLRKLLEILPKQAAYKMNHEIAPRYKGRNGGYTSIEKHLKMRKNDSAKMATIKFV